MLSAKVQGDRQLVGRLSAMPASVQAALEAKARQLAINLQTHIKDDKLSGQVLNVGKNSAGHTGGALKASIQQEVESNPTGVMARIFSAGDVKYAAIHEYGGVIHHPGGTAYIPDGLKSNGVGASFISNAAAAAIGHDLPRTAPHDITMPERSFMRSSLKDMAKGLKQAAIEGARRALKQSA
jgi:phage gpG-like protein